MRMVLTDAAGEMRFDRGDDELTAVITEQEGGRLLTLSNRPEFSPLPSTLTAPGAEGEWVLQILPDGTRFPVAVTRADGVLSFEGPSQGTYLLLPDGVPGGGSDPGAGSSQGSHGPLVRSGKELTGPLAATGVLLLGRVALLGQRRRG